MPNIKIMLRKCECGIEYQEVFSTYTNIMAKLKQRCARRVGHEKVVCSYCFEGMTRRWEGELLILMRGEIGLLLGIYCKAKERRLNSGPAQSERSVEKREVGADFPEGLKTHREGEAQRVLEQIPLSRSCVDPLA